MAYVATSGLRQRSSGWHWSSVPTFGGALPAAMSAETRLVVAKGVTAPRGSARRSRRADLGVRRAEGFCRVTEPSGSTPGAIESNTCLGGAAATVTTARCSLARRHSPIRRPPTAAAAMSWPSFRIPPRDPSGVIRARWSPSARTFSYGGTLTLFGGDLRPICRVGRRGPQRVRRLRAGAKHRANHGSRQRHSRASRLSGSSPRAEPALSRPAPLNSSGRVLLYIAEASALTQYLPPEGRPIRRSGDGVLRARCGRAAHVRSGHRVLYAGTATATAAGGDTIKRVQTSQRADHPGIGDRVHAGRRAGDAWRRPFSPPTTPA